MISGKDDLSKSSGVGADGSLNALELGFSAWLGRTPGKHSYVDRQSVPYARFLNERWVQLDNGSTVNALDVVRRAPARTRYVHLRCLTHARGA